MAVKCLNMRLEDYDGFGILELTSSDIQGRGKETTLERADFVLQLSMFVTAEKEREMFTIFFLSSFCQLLSPRF